MIFEGIGIVRWKGKKIANFIDGLFETNEPKIINRLQMIGFKESANTEVSETTKKWARTQKKAKK